MAFQTHKIFVVGGTGAQGVPIVKELVRDLKYQVVILTRDAKNKRAQDLLSLGNVELLEGTFTDLPLVSKAMESCDGAFVNIDGFNTGEKTEIYWGMRLYELARAAGIKFYVWGNLEYALKKSGYNPECRAGHYDGKGRVGEWVLFQSKNSPMAAATFTTGPYLDMAIAAGTIMTPKIENDTAVWTVPLADGAVAHVALEDCGHYVRWIFDNPEKSNGMDLEVAIAHMTYHEIAAAFSKVTGHAAKANMVDFDTYFDSGLANWADLGAGYNSDVNDPSSMTNRQNFTGFWNIWRHSGGNKGVIQRDYSLLDEILPNRIKSAEEWFRRQQESKGDLWEYIQPGNLQPVLKLSEDGRKGRL